MDTLHTFTLKDAEGNEHEYQMIAHAADEGEEIMWHLTAMAAGPLGALLQSMIGELIVGERSMTELLDTDPKTLFAGVDLAEVGKSLQPILASPTMRDLSAKLLRHTTRDGKALSDKMTRALAYQRNYTEMHRALLEAIRFNRFFPVPGA